jgi:DNA-binding transcriptional MocR family regulator
MLPIRLTSEGPIVVQLEQQIRQLIERGLLLPGRRLPSVRQMAKELGISNFTVVGAYDRLVAANYIRAHRNSGFHVVEQQLDHSPEVFAPEAGKFTANWLFKALQGSPGALKAGAGVLPPDDWFDDDALKHSARSALRRSGTSFAAYPAPLGYRPLRDLLALKLIDTGIAAQSEQILLTSGASHALDLALRTLVGPEDSVLVETPGYHSLYSYLLQNKVRFESIPRGHEGLDLDALEATVRRIRPRLLVINSILHNPTGGSLSPINAHKILGLAEQHDFLIVEDDIYGDFYKGAAFRIANLDQLNRVVYISSFSKTISANLRLGYIAANRNIVRQIADRKLVTYLATSELNERIVAELLTSGAYRRQIERIRQKLARKRPHALARLRQAGMEVAAEPEGGFFLWARSPRVPASERLAEIALHHGLVLAPGAVFSPTSESSPWLRFNVAFCDCAAFNERMAASLKEYASSS